MHLHTASPLCEVNTIYSTQATCHVQVYEQLQHYESAHRALAAQRIPRTPSGNPFAADAPWKREDLHRVGQDDCEKLGGIFYFRILWFNVRPVLSCMLLFSEDSMVCCAHMCAERAQAHYVSQEL